MPNLTALKPRSNDGHCADDIFKCIFLNENVWFSIEVSLEIVPEGLIKNILALVNKWLVWIIVYVDDT